MTPEFKKTLLDNITKTIKEENYGRLVEVRKCPCGQRGCSSFFISLQTKADNAMTEEAANAIADLINHAPELLP